MSNFKSPIIYTFVKCGCSIYFFLKSANLICRSTDISKYFRESLGVRDNESRLYISLSFGGMISLFFGDMNCEDRQGKDSDKNFQLLIYGHVND